MKKTLFWILSFLITVFFAVFQRMTGPTYPVKGTFALPRIQSTVNYSLPRSCTIGGHDCLLKIKPKALFKCPVPPPVVMWKRYKTTDPWSEISFDLKGHPYKEQLWEAVLPDQPPAGKLEYVVRDIAAGARGGCDSSRHELTRDVKGLIIGPESVLVRFKGAVPAYILIPHIILMFLFMLFSVRIFISAAFGLAPVKHSVPATVGFLVLGGFLFGPLTQYYAFGQAWTGFPFGYDLTDNKTLFMLVFWLIALWATLKARAARFWLIAAFLVTAAVYFVPHSMFGSELDYKKGEVVTGGK